METLGSQKHKQDSKHGAKVDQATNSLQDIKTHTLNRSDTKHNRRKQSKDM